MSISAEVVINILSRSIDSSEDQGRERVCAADRAAVQLLAGNQPILPTVDSEHFQLFEDAAAAIDGPDMTEAAKILEAFGDRKKTQSGPMSARDAAANRWTPVIEAAYHVGLALGIRLIMGDEPDAIAACLERQPQLSESVWAGDGLIDSEVSNALKRAVDAIGPERRLLLLTIAEHPELDNRVERVIAGAGEALR